MRNNGIGGAMNLDEKYVALLKHRWIKQLRQQIDRATAGRESGEKEQNPGIGAESLLSEVWEEYRPSWPKRSTMGGYLLGTLEPSWQRHVGLLVHRLRCRCFTSD